MEKAGSADVRGFFDAYRTVFESFDPDAIAGFFTYPCHITSDADPVQLTASSSREEWRETIDGLVALYRQLGVTSAEVLSFEETALSERVTQARVQWGLRDASGAEVYDFHGVYTLVEGGDGWRVAAIAHDELPRLFAALERAG